MVAGGFKKVFVGIETPSAEALQECRKLQNCRRDLVESVQTLQRAGLEVMGGFIVGFDSDPSDIFKRQFDFIQRSGVVTAMVGLLDRAARDATLSAVDAGGPARGGEHRQQHGGGAQFPSRCSIANS